MAVVPAPARPVPILSDPPPGAVAALETAGKTDAEVAAWVIDLDHFYQKQDAFKAARAAGL